MTEIAPELRRRLATILAVDLAGFSARAEEDAAHAVRAVSALEARVRATAQARGGRIFSTAGDGFMLEFTAAESAVEAALDLLIATPDDAQIRIGGHLGDVIESGPDDLLGHGVNVAARLQKEAAEGTAAFSGAVFDAVRGPLAMRLVRRGRLTLDKLRAPVEVFVLDPKSPPGKARWRRRPLPIALMVASLAFVLTAGLFILQQTGVIGLDRRAVAAQMASDPAMLKALSERVTLRIGGGDDANGIGQAVYALGASTAQSEREAFSSLVEGDGAEALNILETFARDLEAQGEREAAAAAYTRMGAIALNIDQGRGISARRRALDLAPNSAAALQGLVLDINLLHGNAAAIEEVDAAIRRPGATDRTIGYANTLKAVIYINWSGDRAATEAALATARAIRDRDHDVALAAAIYWAESLRDFKDDRLVAALDKARRSIASSKELPPDFPRNGDVIVARVLYGMGDWEGVLRESAPELDARWRAGKFIPTPMLYAVCDAGLGLGRAQDVLRYCIVLTRRSDTSGGANARLVSAKLAAMRGDIDVARSELAASDALETQRGEIRPERYIAEGHVAAYAGDVAAAEKAAAAAESVVVARGSYAATINRLLGSWALIAKKPARACAPLARAKAFYLRVGGEPGARAVEEMRQHANCPAR